MKWPRGLSQGADWTHVPQDIRAAALQYVRKVSGFRAPAAHNREVFDQTVDAVAAATQDLLDGLQVRGSTPARRQ
ncbi:DUF2277 domain-containing protein [Streptomyces sp. NPDC058000]|uniref:DUF2277 domain-containing protein n=1 Tax=Streptomyces sp. NPDC058000 TaxID=3346299 RepID=UPI0036E547CE